MIAASLVRRSAVGALIFGTTALLPLQANSQPGDQPLDIHKFEFVKRESGPVNYYTTMQEGNETFIRSDYKPSMKTAVMGIEIPKELRQGTHKLSWKWRARALPTGGNECVNGKGDSAAVVYVTWKSGLRWYTLKYVWSTVGPKGTTCDKKHNFIFQQDTVVLQSGGPLNQWVTETLDPTAEFQRHFRDGNMNADVPDLVGIGIMSDGDQTNSESSADYADFVLAH